MSSSEQHPSDKTAKKRTPRRRNTETMEKYQVRFLAYHRKYEKSSSERHQSDEPATELPPRRRENEVGAEFRTRSLENEREETQELTDSEEQLYHASLRNGGTANKKVFSRKRNTGTRPAVPLSDQSPLPSQNKRQQADNSRSSETLRAREPSAQNTTILRPHPPYYSHDRSLSPVIITSQREYVMEPLPPYDRRPSETAQAREPSPQTIPPNNFTRYGPPSSSVGSNGERVSPEQ